MLKTLATFIVPYLGPRTAIFMAMNTLISDLQQRTVFKESFVISPHHMCRPDFHFSATLKKINLL